MDLSRKVLFKAGLFFVSCLIVLLLSFSGAFNDYEAFLYDLRFRLRPPIVPADEIALVEISDDTLKNLGLWPLPRDFHATLMEVLKELGVRMVVFDVLFSEPTVYDDEFSRALRTAGNVYLPLAFTIDEKPVDREKVPETSHILADLIPALSAQARGRGHINVYLDSDGKVRMVPLFVRYKGELVPQLGFKAACDRLGLDTKAAQFSRGRLIIGKRLVIPVLGRNCLLVNYPARWENSFRHFSYFEILNAYAKQKEGRKTDIDLTELKNKVCFIGLTAAGTSDFQAVPLESHYPLVGLQASVFNSLLKQQFITPAGAAANALAALLVFLISIAFCLRLSPVKACLGSLTLGTAYFVVNTGLFIFAGVWLDLFLPLFILFAVYMVLTAYRFFAESKKRALLEKELEIAQAIQKSFLPQGEVTFSGLDIASALKPAKFVAGDLFDFVKIDDKKFGLFIGDVSGKGVPASLIMAQIISLFRIFSRQSSDPGRVLGQINRELAGRISARFVTCMYVIIDTAGKKVFLASAGHGPLLLYQAGAGGVSEVELNAGLPLGISEDTAYDNVSFDMGTEDKIAVFTDGLTEARDAQAREFGADKVRKVIAQNGRKKCEEVCSRLIEALLEFTRSCPQHDDITLIVVGKV